MKLRANTELATGVLALRLDARGVYVNRNFEEQWLSKYWFSARPTTITREIYRDSIKLGAAALMV